MDPLMGFWHIWKAICLWWSCVCVCVCACLPVCCLCVCVKFNNNWVLCMKISLLFVAMVWIQLDEYIVNKRKCVTRVRLNLALWSFFAVPNTGWNSTREYLIAVMGYLFLHHWDVHHLLFFFVSSKGSAKQNTRWKEKEKVSLLLCSDGCSFLMMLMTALIQVTSTVFGLTRWSFGQWGHLLCVFNPCSVTSSTFPC